MRARQSADPVTLGRVSWPLQQAMATPTLTMPGWP